MTSVAKTTPSMNGTRKFAMRGFITIQLGDNEPEIKLDVKAIFDAWYVVDWRLRDAKGELPNDQWAAHGRDQHEFVQSVVDAAYAAQTQGKQAPMFSYGDAEAFVVMIREEVGKLRSFFSPKKEEPSESSPKLDQERINFSQ